MPIRHDGKKGLVEVYSLTSFIDAMKQIDDIATAKEISEIVGCNSRYAKDKLKRYVADGEINGRNIGGRWIFWI